VAINCAAMPETLLESELFGYKKGAFTDAKRDKPGRISQADGGTLFLDEIADLAKPLQVKLLRFLQERCYEPLGATGTVRELENIIERAFVVCQEDLVDVRSLPDYVRQHRPEGKLGGGAGALLETTEAKLIATTLKKHRGN